MTNVTDQTATDAPSPTSTEVALAEMWRDLIGLSGVDADVDFFAAGGTSLTAIKFLQRVEKTFGADVLTPETLYTSRTLGSVASAIDEALASARPER